MQLEADNVQVSYWAGEPVVQDVSLRTGEGQWLMLLGPNGAGKSTLIKALSATLPYDGTIQINGQDIQTIKTKKLARIMGVLSQYNPINYAFTVEEVVRLGRYAHGGGVFSKPHLDDKEKVDQALQWTGMSSLHHRSMLTLSGGEKQRAFLAQVFAQDPAILLLDEPSSSLDLKHQKRLFDLVRQWAQMPGRCVISAVHDLSLAKMYGTHALLMSGGRAVACGTIKEALSDENLEKVYAMDVRKWMQDMLAQWT